MQLSSVCSSVVCAAQLTGYGECPPCAGYAGVRPSRPVQPAAHGRSRCTPHRGSLELHMETLLLLLKKVSMETLLLLLKKAEQWWSPRLGHGAVLAASKPLQVSKYPSARLGESDIHPISPKTPAPQYQPIDRKKRKGKRVEDYSRDRAA